MLENMVSHRAASTVALTGVGDNRSITITLLDRAGCPIGHATFSQHGFDRLIQAARDVRPTGSGFGELTVTFELSDSLVRERTQHVSR